MKTANEQLLLGDELHKANQEIARLQRLLQEQHEAGLDVKSVESVSGAIAHEINQHAKDNEDTLTDGWIAEIVSRRIRSVYDSRARLLEDNEVMRARIFESNKVMKQARAALSRYAGNGNCLQGRAFDALTALLEMPNTELSDSRESNL